ncbi:hypothetical protein LTR91_009489 [Friedmanniomyces endolithicus]|uniref:Uncharacterized protein n=1 Tax=Friedmanniomyces endolithicus TaxID=329885 RepID=A0AAN6KKV7_9PEZI|nr:hypothetical protein LTR94_013539 [Friedmanniomyces endolithicus]KAK0781401.1 hypothetical protein LTR59_012498 [Friedmanniomyces endolithicus]KAK0790465.1 hypothetical protein LTR38_010573 [Friedmanniomyces endolithicus]KAK0840719.1 hypothetical protein LTR03_010397 [Friedmanniomyces endolithicus]KAK0900887.1 hypothetical protein LTR57_020422 [Friedmanniomyces endolithicus]
MAYEVIHTAPQTSDFTGLSDHQEQTPGTFFGGKSVLHLHCTNAKLQMTRLELANHSDFAALSDCSNDWKEAAEITGMEFWVTSRYFVLWSNTRSMGIQIPYPTISLHAEDGVAVLLQLTLSDPNTTADEDLQVITPRLVPHTAGLHGDIPPVIAHSDAFMNGEATVVHPQQRLYNAISACQELNPDPNLEDDDEDGMGFGETAPGATGWITSENMADFVDEDGNFRMPEGATMIGGEDDGLNDEVDVTQHGLGPGAGTTRTAADRDSTDGAEDEGKWQRTG